LIYIIKSLLGLPNLRVPGTPTSGVFDRRSDDLELAAWRVKSSASEIRRVALTVLSSFLRQSCLVFTNVTSALEVFNVMSYMNPRFTYLLTYVEPNTKRCDYRHYFPLGV